jgi:tetratricopeptide (TPR) repeat protein
VAIRRLRKSIAEALHERGRWLDRQGHSDEAIAAYLRAIAWNAARADSHYNIGLIHKYRGEWQQSFAFNHRANELEPEDDATRWNLAIAATALRDWATARRIWAAAGFILADGEGPIHDDFGITLVRLHPDGEGEVVWARRIDPVRARIENIPLPHSGFRYGDVVLHDGAPVGERTYEGRTYSVFNVLELFERSDYETLEAEVEIAEDDDLVVLDRLLDAKGCSFEEWSRTVRILCRQCSEGHPHETHDHELAPEWSAHRVVAIAARPGVAVSELLVEWAHGAGRRFIALRPASDGAPRG